MTHAAPIATASGYPTDDHHRPYGWLRHLGGIVTSDAAIPALHVALEHSRRQRWDRLISAASERRTHPSRATMRALVASPGGRIRWRDVPAPASPEPLAAIVHPIAIATCDLDRPMALGRTPFALPMHLGHECVAQVVEVGESVTSVRPGDQVVVPFQISCGTCPHCRAGLTSNCQSVPPISMYGFGVTGGHWGGAYSDLLTVPFADGMLVPLPPDVDPAAAASVGDNVADGYRGVAPHLPLLLARDPDAEVLILADIVNRPPFSASVALYAGLTARALGAKTIHFVDRRPHVRRHAQELGMNACTPRELRRLPPAALVVDTTGVSAGTVVAVKHTAPDGICASLASLSRSSPLPTALMYGRNITFTLGRSDAHTHIPAILDLMRSGRLQPENVTSHHDSLDRADRAVRAHVFGEATKTIVTE